MTVAEHYAIFGNRKFGSTKISKEHQSTATQRQSAETHLKETQETDQLKRNVA